MTSSAAVQRPLLERVGPIPGWGPLAPFLAISAQLGVLLLLLKLFQIEPGTGLLSILPLVFVGFVVHAALPMPWRLPFFLLLSFGAIGVVLGPVAGAVLVLIALVLIGTCHLPIAFSARVLLLLLMVGVLAAIRKNWLAVPTALTSAIGLPALPKIVVPVLASMFMFRLIIYMYDLRHEERGRAAGTPLKGVAAQPASVWSRLSYFFLLPNVCFLLFPIVDYRSYRRTYYDTDAQAIYQKGVWWICLGLVQLLIYRVVYQYLVPSPEQVQGLAGVVRFMLAAYLIYFRVVGQFQLIVGLLCLFGFNLPAPHRFYLLASSFTDFWRRARIEWKDFMVKIFYYPALVPLQRRMGATLALIVATVWVFFVTWLLHGYQWFWLIGEFRILGNDAVFWTLIGGCVLVNSLLENSKGRARAGSRWNSGRAAVHAAKVVGMFSFMCILWSYWSSSSFSIWVSYLTAAKDSGWGAYALLVAALLGAVAAGVLAQFIAFRRAAGRAALAKAAAGSKPRTPLQPVTWTALAWRPAAVVAAAAVLLLMRAPATRQALAAPVDDVVSTLSTDKLNAVDQEREDRGYYEELLDTPRSTGALAASAGSLKDAATGNIPAVGSPQAEESGEDAPVEDTAAAVPPPNTPPGPPAKASPGGTTKSPGAGQTKPHTDEDEDAPIGSAPVERHTDAGAATATVATAHPRVARSTATAGALRRGPALGLAVLASQPAPRRTHQRVLAARFRTPSNAWPNMTTRQRSLPTYRSQPTPLGQAVASPAALEPGQQLKGRWLKMTGDFLRFELRPSFTVSYQGRFPFTTNRWGMRDKDYSLTPPPNTYRIALLGSSVEMGAGVPVEQDFESVLESRLNREGPRAPRRHYEILNFSVGSYSILQNMVVVERKLPPFAPNAIMVAIHSLEPNPTLHFLISLIQSKTEIPYPYIREKLRQAGVEPGMAEPELRRRLQPVVEDIMRFGYQRIAEVAHARKLPVIAMLVPRSDLPPGEGKLFAKQAQIAEQLGMVVLSLEGAFKASDSVRLPPPNNHPNARGHQLLADRLYDQLRANDARALKLGFGT